MNGRYVLDTNVVIAFFDREPFVLQRIGAAEETLVPIPVMGELFYGAYHSRRSEFNTSRIEQLAHSHTVIPVDMETAVHYGMIKSALRRRGTPIPDNDIWIAALAKQHDATVATRDAHFDAIEKLAVERW